jgi:hypothetical protein
MLAQRLGLSINSTRPLGKWSPDDETSLEAWYQNQVGITLNGSDVSAWADSTTNLRLKIDGTIGNLPLDSGTFGDDYIVITRVSNVLTLWKNGVAQSTTPTLAGTADIDAIGVRNSDQDFLDGTVEEVQIYSSSSADLTSNVNDRLSTL